MEGHFTSNEEYLQVRILPGRLWVDGLIGMPFPF